MNKFRLRVQDRHVVERRARTVLDGLAVLLGAARAVVSSDGVTVVSSDGVTSSDVNGM